MVKFRRHAALSSLLVAVSALAVSATVAAGASAQTTAANCLLKDVAPLPLSDPAGDAGGRAVDIVGGQVAINSCQVSEQVVTAAPFTADSGQYLVVLWDTVPGQGQPQSGADFALAYSPGSQPKLEIWDGSLKQFAALGSASVTVTANPDGTTGYSFSWDARLFALRGGLTPIVSVLSVYLGADAQASEYDQTDLPLTVPLSALPDRTPPNVSIRSASGRAGSDVKIHFYVGDNSGEARFVVSLYNHHGRLVGSDRWTMEPVDGNTELATHYQSRRAERGFRGKVCVQAIDPSGNSSRRRCARFTLR